MQFKHNKKPSFLKQPSPSTPANRRNLTPEPNPSPQGEPKSQTQGYMDAIRDGKTKDHMNGLELNTAVKAMQQFGKIDSHSKAAFMVFLECAHAKRAMNELKTFRMEAALATEQEHQLLNTAYNALSELHRIYDTKLGLGIFK